jgi:hypothetical protein
MVMRKYGNQLNWKEDNFYSEIVEGLDAIQVQEKKRFTPD